MTIADEGAWGMPDENLPAKEVAKVANNFLNKVSKAVGAVYEPFHLKRMAKAEAKAKAIRVQGDVEITDIQRRAEQRWLHEEVRNQENIEAIIRKAIPDLRPDAKPEGMNDDWVTGFFDYAKKISDEEMQSLWAKILAGEANAPGSFTKQVLQIVWLLEKDDAELFTSLCRFCLRIEDEIVPIVLTCQSGSLYTKEKLHFGNLTHLDALGLIRFDGISGFIREDISRRLTITYGRNSYVVELPEHRANYLSTGRVLFTEVGRRLAPLCNAEAVLGFDEYVLSEWRREGIQTVSSTCV